METEKCEPYNKLCLQRSAAVFNHKPSVTDGHLSMNSLLNAPVEYEDEAGNEGLQVGAAGSWQMIGWDNYAHPPFPVPMNQGFQDLKGAGGITSSNLGDSEELFGAGFSTGGNGRTTASLNSLANTHSHATTTRMIS